MSSRIEERITMSPETRLRLLEGDLDRNDDALEQIRKLIAKLLWTSVGLLISVTVGVIVFASTAGLKP